METLRALTIHLIVPLIGLGLFEFLRRRMYRENIGSPPNIEIFVLFVCYGGWLLVILTGLFWFWSGMASLGFFFLLAIAPLFLLGCSYRLFLHRKISKYHLIALYASILYIAIMIVLWLVMISSSVR